MTRTTSLIAVALSAICLACGSDDSTDEHSHAPGEEHEALTATLAPKSDNTTLAGTATFSGDTGKVQVKVDVSGAPAGTHGLHLHETGDCSAADATSAGAHWNPTAQMHGALGTTAHLGDIGNITIAADGKGTLTATHPLWEVGTGTANDVKGKAVVVHGMADDLTSQPVGNAGARIGCGVVE